MEEQRILIADKNTRYLRRITDYFTSAGYKVEMTDSASHVLCSVLKKQSPVVLLGSDFDDGIDFTHLLQLLKRSNRHLTVIMVSDDAALPVVQRAREEGIFYHALRPRAPEDDEEIVSAVECAFRSKVNRREHEHHR